MPDEQHFASHAINQALTLESKERLYREMLRCRRFEINAMNGYCMGHMAGFLVLQTGQEAIAVAVRSLMGPCDHSICGMRGIGHALAAGMTMREGMAELYGRATGVARGKAGMLGFYAPAHRHWGNHGLAGTQTALAAGLAFALKHRGEIGAVCCFLGEGAMNQGVVHESLNLAGLFNLPVVFIIENNGYAFGTTEARSSVRKNCLAQRAEGYGIAWDKLNGDDIYEVRAKTQPALERARHEQRPTVLEMSTYRFQGFSVADAGMFKYRTRAEVDERVLNHDPLLLWQAQLEREGLWNPGQMAMIQREVQAEADDASWFARHSPFPDASTITENITWEADHAADLPG